MQRKKFLVYFVFLCVRVHTCHATDSGNVVFIGSSDSGRTRNREADTRVVVAAASRDITNY